MPLDTGIQPATKLPKPFGLDQMAADISRDESLYTKRQAELSEKQSGIAADREKALAPMEKAITERLAEPYPERPKSDIPQFKPQPIVDAKEYESLSYGLIAMAMIGGVASKGKWLEVGDALNGALHGYMEGNMQVAQKRYKDYDEQFKGAIAKENQANREFEDILKNKQLRIRDQISQYRIVAAKYDRQDALAAAQGRNLDAMWRSLESRKTSAARLQESHDRTQEMMGLRWQALNDKRTAAGTGSAGLSEKYSSDPQYKKNVDFWAGILQKGGSLPPRFAQSGAGKTMMPDIINVVPTLGSGNPADIGANKLSVREMTAEANKLGTQAASVAIANKELGRFIPAAEKAMDAVPRTGWKPLNLLIQAGENTWSPEQKQLVIANRAAQTAYAQLIQRGAPTVHSSEEAEKMLTTADSPAVYKAALAQLKVEGEQAELGLKDARDELMSRARNIGKDEVPDAGGGAPAKIPEGWKVKEH